MSIVGDYDNGQFDDYYEICDREYDEEIHWDLKTLLNLAEELPMYITGLALSEDKELIEYLGEHPGAFEPLPGSGYLDVRG